MSLLWCLTAFNINFVVIVLNFIPGLLRPLDHSNDEKACMETSFGLDNCTPRTRVIPTRSKSLVGNRPVSCFAQPRIQNSKYCNPVSLVASGTIKTNPG